MNDTTPQGKVISVSRQIKHKRRFCKVQDCERIVKSQGLCQRHGARPRKCRVTGCNKQAQGSFGGMCKSHFKDYRAMENAPSSPRSNASPGPAPASPPPDNSETVVCRPVTSFFDFLKAGHHANKGLGWHRNEERIKRTFRPACINQEMEAWEMDLIAVEILALQHLPNAFVYLAYAWGKQEDVFFREVVTMHPPPQAMQGVPVSCPSSPTHLRVSTVPKHQDTPKEDVIFSIIKHLLVSPYDPTSAAELGCFGINTPSRAASETSVFEALLIAILLAHQK